MLKNIFSITLATTTVINTGSFQDQPKLFNLNKNLKNKKIELLSQNNINIPEFLLRNRHPSTMGITRVIGIRGHNYGGYTSDGRSWSISKVENLPEWYDSIEIKINSSTNENNSDFVDFVVQIYDITNKVDYKMLYIREGSTAFIDIPPGRYIVKCAIGKNWVNEKALFGENTYYFQLEKTINSKENKTSKTTFSFTLNGSIDSRSTNAVNRQEITAEQFEPPN